MPPFKLAKFSAGLQSKEGTLGSGIPCLSRQCVVSFPFFFFFLLTGIITIEKEVPLSMYMSASRMSSEREMAQCLAQARGSLAISFFYPVFVTEKGSPVPDNRLFRQPCWLVFPHLPGPSSLHTSTLSSSSPVPCLNKARWGG